MNTTTVFDKNFSITRSEEYSLSIQVSLDGFSFLVQDLSTHKFCGLKHIAFPDPVHKDDLSKKLLSTLEKETLAEANYASVQVVYWTPKVTIIPAPLFDLNKLRSYFEFNTVLAEGEAIYSQQVKSIASYIAFAVPSDISTFVGQFFHNASFHCQSQAIIESTLKKKHDGKNEAVYLQVSSSFFDITIISNGKLQLHNCFKYSNAADFTYFIMNIFQQFQINPEFAPIYISGSITKLSDEFAGINRYIKNISFSDHYAQGKFTNAFSDKDLHRFASIIELSSCE